MPSASSTDSLCLQWDSALVPAIATQGLQNDLIARPLARDDHTRHHLALLRILTEAPDLTSQAYEDVFDSQAACPGTYYTLVFVRRQPGDAVGSEAKSEEIVASGTLVLERKYLRDAGKVGHIEDIAVSASMQGTGLGKRLVTSLEKLAADLGAYKTILDCSAENKAFYEKCGFVQKEFEMAKYASKP